MSLPITGWWRLYTHVGYLLIQQSVHVLTLYQQVQGYYVWLSINMTLKLTCSGDHYMNL